ncbi:hypothetical protein BMS3Abin15_01098 [bacterium BMS3Abin15]|nr:hypothetical protein BMS3Abin06_02415 [bacterium BMS3Abin06]GBE17258.1 hypothetical protein BMS3Abin15_01098 [bacterium BMS3Abin15]
MINKTINLFNSNIIRTIFDSVINALYKHYIKPGKLYMYNSFIVLAKS